MIVSEGLYHCSNIGVNSLGEGMVKVEIPKTKDLYRETNKQTKNKGSQRLNSVVNSGEDIQQVIVLMNSIERKGLKEKKCFLQF